MHGGTNAKGTLCRRLYCMLLLLPAQEAWRTCPLHQPFLIHAPKRQAVVTIHSSARFLRRCRSGSPRLTNGGQLRGQPRCGNASLLLVSYCWPQRLIGPPERRRGSLTPSSVTHPAEAKPLRAHPFQPRQDWECRDVSDRGSLAAITRCILGSNGYPAHRPSLPTNSVPRPHPPRREQSRKPSD